MRLLFLMLLLINIAAIGYIRFAERRAGADDQAALLQINPDKVKLLKPATSPAADTQKSSSLPAAQRACLEWGTFSPDDSPRVAAALTALQPPLKVSQRQSDDTYWVHIPSLRTRADALNTASQLKARGVGNSFVVQDRDPANFAISLGEFKNEAGASAYLAELAQKGVHSAVISPRAMKTTTFIIDDPGDALASRITQLTSDFPTARLTAVSYTGL